jgi:nucleoside phosphorylase
MAALAWEVRPFLRRVKATRRRGTPYPAWEFAAGEGRAVLALSGMGREAALQTAARLLADFRPQVLGSVGFGGSLAPELTPGAVVLGASFWWYDPVHRLLVTIRPPAPPRPLEDLVRCLKGAGVCARPGSLITTPFIIHKGREGAWPRRLPGPVLDLETGPLAEMAAARDLAFFSLRVITDGAAEEVPEFLVQGSKSNLKMGPMAALGWLAADPRRIRPLLDLWRRAAAAAERLAEALVALLPVLKV